MTVALNCKESALLIHFLTTGDLVLKNIFMTLLLTSMSFFSTTAIAGGGDDDNTITIESKFLDQLTDHHKEAIEMAMMATSKGFSADVRIMAQKMADDQTREIAQMQNWRESYYASVPIAPPMPKMDMTPLQNATGKEFDRIFLTMMIQHHSDGIQMINSVLSGLVHHEIIHFAQKVAKAQTDEIAKMEEMKEH
jgi:uncharacterized protein (DUF305 family)